MAADQAPAPDDWLTKGRAIQTQLWGEPVGSGRSPMPSAELAPDFFPLVTQFAFGMFWSRPELPVRDRSLITVAMLAALGRLEELRGHLAGARNVGIPKEQLVEVLMQVAVYAGVPAAVSALRVAAEVLGGS
ncbi:MAG TPA: carboxymuconolactone decarboxylase family protein [Acidimicrobiia bacterium]|nr:carboxymuconolactone decarboxylase family protein [Acidimicrobiia bacterium]